MKKGAVLVVSSLCLLGLAGCNQEAGKTAGSATNDSEVLVNTSTEACLTCAEKSTVKDSSTIPDGEVEQVKTVFSGVLTGDAKEVPEQKAVQIFLKEVKAIEDQENIVKSFEGDGVILNTPTELLKELPTSELVKGTQVEVTLKGLPIMTMSIPPQIPGNSIVAIEISK